MIKKVLLNFLFAISFFVIFSFIEQVNADNSMVPMPGYMNGSTLLYLCNDFIQTNGEYGVNTVSCESYVEGSLDGFFGAASLTDPQYTKCFLQEHPGITVNQVIRMTVNFLNKHPEFLDSQAASLSRSTITSAFPVDKRFWS